MLAEAALWAAEAARRAQQEYAWGVSQAELELREELLWNPGYLGSDEFWEVVEEATEGLLQESVQADLSASQAKQELKAQLERMRQLGARLQRDADSVDFSHRAREFRITSSYL
jgi:hypothetical protein